MTDMKRTWEKIKELGWREKAGIAVLTATPFLMYILFEWTTGNLLSVRGVYLFFNLALFALIYFTAFAFTNSMRTAYLTLNLVFFVWSAAEYFVVEFRGRPIMLWDIMAVRTAATVAGNYQYVPSFAMVASGLILIGWGVLIWKFPVKIHSRKRHLAAAAAMVSITAVGTAAFFGDSISRFQIEIGMWDPAGSYAEYGYMISTLRMAGYLSVKAPEGYSVSAVHTIQDEIEEARTDMELEWAADTDVVPENIICIMNESFSDLRVIGEFSTDLPFLSYYDSLSENCIKGEAYVPVFGSMTCNTEYEFLTGNSMAFAPENSVPFQIYTRNPEYSLPLILKNYGYRTVALHPYPKSNWNRENVYRNMGFDEFYGLEYFQDSPLIRNYVSDLGDYQKIIELTEEKGEGTPLFVFNVTMQNHGGYEDEYEATVHLTDMTDMPMAEQYLSLIRESDQALQYLIEYYSQIDEPTMIVLFGDHQPSIEPEFYETLYGSPISELSPEKLVERYITPFIIWTNYETDCRMDEKMSVQYFPCAILERANLELTDYMCLLDTMYQSAPVVHIFGYYNSDYEWESWTGWKEKKEYPVFHQFELLQYYNMFGKNRDSSLFLQ